MDNINLSNVKVGDQVVLHAHHSTQLVKVVRATRTLIQVEGWDREFSREYHLITRDERPVKASRREDGGDVDETDDTDLLSGMEEDEDEDDGRERIGEDESEAAPAAID
jgi:hypothetical protein